MPPGDGWYLIGPLLAAALVGFLATVFWHPGLDFTAHLDEPLRELYRHGLAILGEPDDDYGLLYPAAVTGDAEVADEIRRLLAQAGIRATQAVGRDGLVAVLVFADEVDEARRLVGGSQAV
jgi:hypothetical protein